MLFNVHSQSCCTVFILLFYFILLNVLRCCCSKSSIVLYFLAHQNNLHFSIVILCTFWFAYVCSYFYYFLWPYSNISFRWVSIYVKVVVVVFVNFWLLLFLAYLRIVRFGGHYKFYNLKKKKKMIIIIFFISLGVVRNMNLYLLFLLLYFLIE